MLNFHFSVLMNSISLQNTLQQMVHGHLLTSYVFHGWREHLQLDLKMNDLVLITQIICLKADLPNELVKFYKYSLG